MVDEDTSGQIPTQSCRVPTEDQSLCTPGTAMYHVYCNTAEMQQHKSRNIVHCLTGQRLTMEALELELDGVGNSPAKSLNSRPSQRNLVRVISTMSLSPET